MIIIEAKPSPTPGVSKLSAKPWRPNIIDVDIDIPDETRITVQRKRHIPIVYIAVMLFGTTFIGFGISSVVSLISNVTTQISYYFTASTGWSTSVSYLVWAMICFVVATFIFVGANRGKEVTPYLRQLLDANVDPNSREFYDLGIVETKFLIREFKRRGCRTYGDLDQQGFQIHCNDQAFTKELRIAASGNYDKMTTSARFVEFFGLNVFPIIYMAFLYYGFANGSDIAWWFWFLMVVGSSVIMLDNRVISLWFSVIYLGIYLGVAYLLFIPNLSFILWWTFVGIAIVWLCLVLVILRMKRRLCGLEDHWYCELL